MRRDREKKPFACRVRLILRCSLGTSHSIQGLCISNLSLSPLCVHDAVGLVVGSVTGFANQVIRSEDYESLSTRISRRASSGVGNYFDQDASSEEDATEDDRLL